MLHRNALSVLYAVADQPPNSIRSQLTRLGMDTGKLEANNVLQIVDLYTPTLGIKSAEKYSAPSMKVQDASIAWAKALKEGKRFSDVLRIGDDHSVFARFNEDRAWVELIITRHVPLGPAMDSTAIVAYLRGVHPEWVYKRLEAAYDGVVEFKLDDSGEQMFDLMRIASIRNVGFDRSWHRLNVEDNLRVKLA